jgi:hypothetical protein
MITSLFFASALVSAAAQYGATQPTPCENEKLEPLYSTATEAIQYNAHTTEIPKYLPQSTESPTYIATTEVPKYPVETQDNNKPTPAYETQIPTPGHYEAYEKPSQPLASPSSYASQIPYSPSLDEAYNSEKPKESYAILSNSNIRNGASTLILAIAAFVL